MISPSEKASDKEEDEEVNKLWDVDQIPTDEEQVVCCMHRCIDPEVATWSSHLYPKDKQDLCNKCQLEEMGGLPDGVDLIKHSVTTNNDDRYNDDENKDSDGKQEDQNEINWLSLIEKENILSSVKTAIKAIIKAKGK